MIGLRPPLINGVEFTHADIVLNIGGVVIIGCTSIEYGDAQEINLLHGTGHKPINRTFGPVSPTGSITLLHKEVQRLVTLSPGGRIQNLPDFNIGVNYINDNGEFVRHALLRCRFKNNNVSSAVNNTQLETTLELSIGDINYAA